MFLPRLCAKPNFNGPYLSTFHAKLFRALCTVTHFPPGNRERHASFHRSGLRKASLWSCVDYQGELLNDNTRKVIIPFMILTNIIMFRLLIVLPASITLATQAGCCGFVEGGGVGVGVVNVNRGDTKSCKPPPARGGGGGGLLS